MLLNGRDQEAEEISKIENCLSLRWKANFKISDNFNKKRRVEHLRKPANLPCSSDITAIRNYTLEKIKHIMDEPITNKKQYVLLRKRTFCRLVLFNGRRVNEPSRLTIAAFTDAVNKTFYMEKDVNELNSEELSIVNSLLITFVPAKNSSKSVSIIFPKDLVRPIKVLINDNVRKSLGISEKMYGFCQLKGNYGAVLDWHELESCHKHCKMDNRVTATKMRHYLSTNFKNQQLLKAKEICFTTIWAMIIQLMKMYIVDFRVFKH